MTGLAVLAVSLSLPDLHLRFGGYLVYGPLAGALSLIGLFGFYWAMARGPLSLFAALDDYLITIGVLLSA